MNRKFQALVVAASAVIASSASAITVRIMDGGVLNVGDCLINEGVFEADTLYGVRVTIPVNVFVGSGFGLTFDAAGSQAAFGTDAELGVYLDGGAFYAGNDDGGTVNGVPQGLDPYVWFGDAPVGVGPFNGFTRQGNAIVNPLNLAAGTYVFLIGPFDTRWDEFDVNDSTISSSERGGWYCNLCLIPTPASAGFLALGGLVLTGRRRRN